MGLQSGLLHLILKCDAQQQEQRTQNTHAAQRGLGELAVPLFIIRGGLPNVYGTACAAALRGTDRDYGFSVSHAVPQRKVPVQPQWGSGPAGCRCCAAKERLHPA